MNENKNVEIPYNNFFRRDVSVGKLSDLIDGLKNLGFEQINIYDFTCNVVFDDYGKITKPNNTILFGQEPSPI